MSDDPNDAGVIAALVERFEKERLPRALKLKEKVDAGGTLDEFDIAFLERVFEDTGKMKTLLDNHPEWQDLAAQAIHLYSEITRKALENEEAAP